VLTQQNYEIQYYKLNRCLVSHCKFISVLSLLLPENANYYVTSNGCFINRQSLKINCSLGAVLNICCVILQVKMTRNMFPVFIVISNDCNEMLIDVRMTQDAVTYKKDERTSVGRSRLQ
jgi:hypothetical protein